MRDQTTSKDTSNKHFESETTALTGTAKKHEYLDYDKIKNVYSSFHKVKMPRFVMGKNYMLSPMKRSNYKVKQSLNDRLEKENKSLRKQSL